MSECKIKPRNIHIILHLRHLYNAIKIHPIENFINPDDFYKDVVMDFYNTLGLGKLTRKSVIPATTSNISQLISELEKASQNVYKKILEIDNLPFKNETTLKFRVLKIKTYNDNIDHIEFNLIYPALFPEESYEGKINDFMNEVSETISSMQIDIPREKQHSSDYNTYQIESLNISNKKVLFSTEFIFEVTNAIKAIEILKAKYGTGDIGDYKINEHYYSLAVENKNIKIKFFKYISLQG